MMFSPEPQLKYEITPQPQAIELDTGQQDALQDILHKYQEGSLDVDRKHPEIAMHTEEVEGIVVGIENLLSRDDEIAEITEEHAIEFIGILVDEALTVDDAKLNDDAKALLESERLKKMIVDEAPTITDLQTSSTQDSVKTLSAADIIEYQDAKLRAELGSQTTQKFNAIDREQAVAPKKAPYHRSFKQEWFDQNRGLAAEKTRLAHIEEHGPISAAERAIMNRGISVEYPRANAPTSVSERIGHKAINAAAKVTDRLKGEQDVLEVEGFSDFLAAQYAVREVKGDKHPLVNQSWIDGRSSDSLFSAVQGYDLNSGEQPKQEYSGRNAKVIRKSLETVAKQADVLKARGEEPSVQMAAAAHLLEKLVDTEDKSMPPTQRDLKLAHSNAQQRQSKNSTGLRAA